MHCAQACPGAIMLMPARVAAATVERRVILLACALSLARRAAREQDADAPKPKISEESIDRVMRCPPCTELASRPGGAREYRSISSSGGRISDDSPAGLAKCDVARHRPVNR